MGSTICPRRSNAADLEWTVLHAAKTTPERALSGSDRQPASKQGRLFSDSSGSGFGDGFMKFTRVARTCPTRWPPART
ncbi:hypothetical protein ACWD3Z_47100, partial [Streptomyces sp. NPDC002740]